MIMESPSPELQAMPTPRVEITPAGWVILVGADEIAGPCKTMRECQDWLDAQDEGTC